MTLRFAIMVGRTSPSKNYPAGQRLYMGRYCDRNGDGVVRDTYDAKQWKTRRGAQARASQWEGAEVVVVGS